MDVRKGCWINVMVLSFITYMQQIFSNDILIAATLQKAKWGCLLHMINNVIRIQSVVLESMVLMSHDWPLFALV